MAINLLANALKNGSEFGGQTGGPDGWMRSLFPNAPPASGGQPPAGGPPAGYRGTLWQTAGAAPARGQPPAGGVPNGYRGQIWPGGMAAGTGRTLEPTGGPPLANPGLGARSTGLPTPAPLTGPIVETWGRGGSAGFNAPGDGGGPAGLSPSGGGGSPNGGGGFNFGQAGSGIGASIGGTLGGMAGGFGGGLVGGLAGNAVDTARANDFAASRGWADNPAMTGYGTSLASAVVPGAGLVNAVSNAFGHGNAFSTQQDRLNDMLGTQASSYDPDTFAMESMALNSPTQYAATQKALGMPVPTGGGGMDGGRAPGLAGQGGYTNPAGGGMGDPMGDLGRQDFGQQTAAAPSAAPDGGQGGGGSGRGGGGAGNADVGGTEGGGNAEGFAAGGFVTPDRLIGPNPPGPDEGYAALQSGEIVIPREQAMMMAQALQLPAMPPPSATRGLTDDQVRAMQAQPAPPPQAAPTPQRQQPPVEDLIRALRFGFGKVPTPAPQGPPR